MLFPLLPGPGAAHGGPPRPACCWPAGWPGGAGLVDALGARPGWMTGYWATREVTSYQFYLIAGMVMALHLDEFHQWLCAHVWTIVLGTVVAAGGGRGLVLPVGRSRGLVARLELRPVPADRDSLQHRRHRLHLSDRRRLGRSAPLHARPRAISVRLGQLLRRLPGPAAVHHALSWLGWSRLNNVLPWPVVSVLTVALVFMACIGLTEVLARTPVEQAAHRALAGPVACAPRRPSRPRPRPPRPLRPSDAAERTGRGAQSDLRRRRPARRRSPGSPSSLGCRLGPMGGAVHIQVSAQTRATLVGTVPSPERVDRGGVVEIEGRADVGHRHAGLGIGGAHDVVRAARSRRGWLGRRPARPGRGASSPR